MDTTAGTVEDPLVFLRETFQVLPSLVQLCLEVSFGYSALTTFELLLFFADLLELGFVFATSAFSFFGAFFAAHDALLSLLLQGLLSRRFFATGSYLGSLSFNCLLCLSLLTFSFGLSGDSTGSLGSSKQLHVEKLLFALGDLSLLRLLFLFNNGHDFLEKSVS